MGFLESPMMGLSIINEEFVSLFGFWVSSSVTAFSFFVTSNNIRIRLSPYPTCYPIILVSKLAALRCYLGFIMYATL